MGVDLDMVEINAGIGENFGFQHHDIISLPPPPKGKKKKKRVLPLSQTTKIIDRSKFKAFADDKFITNQPLKLVHGRV